VFGDDGVDGTNWYSYVNNDPISFIDPFGSQESDSQASTNTFITWAEKPK
jgi:hypothetical protein